jgi:type II secretory pathway component PulF
LKYHYSATQSDNRLVEGDLDAANTGEVLEFLGTKGLKPISINPIRELTVINRGSFFESISATDKVFLTKYLSLMLRVGTDLLKALDILIADFNKASVKALLLEIKIAISKGQPFYSTFAKYPKLFSPVFINLIKAGEVSGTLELVFENLNVMLEKEQDLKRKIRAALVYPILLMAVSFMVLMFLIMFALPKIAGLFSSGNFHPPLFSRVVFAIGLFVGDHVIVIISIILGSIIGGSYFFFKTNIGKRALLNIFMATPVVKGVVQKISIQRLATTLAALMKAGVPIIEALNITANSLGNEKMSLALKRIAYEGVARGLTLGDAFKKETAFPQVIINLIAVSEKSGHMEEILKTLADFYESEIDASLKILVSFIEPVMLLIIGVIIGLIALSIIVPIYQLVGTVQ